MVDTETQQADAIVRKLASFQTLIAQFDNLSAITPKFFIENLEQITTLANCTNDEKILIMKSRLRGDALSNVINSPDLNQEKNFDEFKKKFLAFFDTQYSLGARQRQFSNCKMLPRELVKVYAAKVSLATQHFFNNPDLTNEAVKSIFEQSKLAKFIEGLLPSYKQSVILKDPKTYDEAVSFVQMLQSNDISSFDAELNPAVNNVNTNAATEQLKTLMETHASHTQEIVNSLTKEVETLKLQSQDRGQQVRNQYTRPPFRQPSGYNNRYIGQTRYYAQRNFPSCNFCKKSHRSIDCYFNPSNKTVYRGGFHGNRRGTFRTTRGNRYTDNQQIKRYDNRQQSGNA